VCDVCADGRSETGTDRLSQQLPDRSADDISFLKSNINPDRVPKLISECNPI
jgi:hypothetical protein